MSEYQRLKVQEANGIHLVSFVDQKILDRANIEQLGNELNSLVESTPGIKLVLDFAKVEFMSSAALGKLVSLEKRVRKSSGQIRLCRIRPEIYEVFQITSLDKVFQIHPSVEAAAGTLS